MQSKPTRHFPWTQEQTDRLVDIRSAHSWDETESILNSEFPDAHRSVASMQRQFARQRQIEDEQQRKEVTAATERPPSKSSTQSDTPQSSQAAKFDICTGCPPIRMADHVSQASHHDEATCAVSTNRHHPALFPVESTSRDPERITRSPIAPNHPALLEGAHFSFGGMTMLIDRFQPHVELRVNDSPRYIQDNLGRTWGMFEVVYYQLDDTVSFKYRRGEVQHLDGWAFCTLPRHSRTRMCM